MPVNCIPIFANMGTNDLSQGVSNKGHFAPSEKAAFNKYIEQILNFITKGVQDPIKTAHRLDKVRILGHASDPTARYTQKFMADALKYGPFKDEMQLRPGAVSRMKCEFLYGSFKGEVRIPVKQYPSKGFLARMLLEVINNPNIS